MKYINAVHDLLIAFSDLPLDEDTRDLLQVAILETFWADKVLFSFAKKYMHPHTRELFNSIGEYLFRP